MPICDEQKYDPETREFMCDVEVPRRRVRKIDPVKFEELKRKGWTNAKIARYFNCSRASVSQHEAKLKHGMLVEAAGVAPQIIAREIRATDQMLKINQKANVLLDSLEVEEAVEGDKPVMKIKDPNLYLKTMGEIRQQLRLQMDIMGMLYDAKAVKEFQDTIISVLDTVEAECPKCGHKFNSGIKERAVVALRRKNAIRAAVAF